jgi:hypothetical protein
MKVTDVRSADHGDGALIEVRFTHSKRSGSSFVVRFSLTGDGIVLPDEVWDDETAGCAASVIWANMMEIAALPNDYLPRGSTRREVEVFA